MLNTVFLNNFDSIIPKSHWFFSFFLLIHSDSMFFMKKVLKKSYLKTNGYSFQVCQVLTVLLCA